MLYPFVTRSLTKKIDDEIHLAVRRAAPVKYWTFRVSSLFERAGFALVVASFFIYFVAYSVVRSTGQLDNPYFEIFVGVLAKGVVAGISLSVIGAIFASTFFREIEPLARVALRGVVNDAR